MSLKLYVSFLPINVRRTVFPAGETCFVIEDEKAYIGETPRSAQITMNFESNSDLFDLALLVDATRRLYTQGVDISLHMPYLPYARQDRVCNKGESLSVKVVADFINSLGFVSVICNDIHSAVGAALIDRLSHVDLVNSATSLLRYIDRGDVVLVSPDAGAEKKVFDFAKAYHFPSVVRASKVRNVATGKIEATTLIDVVPDTAKTLLIVDDICDGGRTFIELAKALKATFGRGKPEIHLYVTHGIFSAGLDVFNGFIDRIYVHNLMNKSQKDHPILQQV